MTVSEFNTPSVINQLVRVSESIIGGETVNSVDARDLYSFLEVRENFSEWIKRYLTEYGFVINSDFCRSTCIAENGREMETYIIILDMAKELSMLSKTSKGKDARKYFIQCDKINRENKQIRLQLLIEEKAARVLKANIIIANAFGLIGNQGLLSANMATKNSTGMDCMASLGITGLISETQEQHFTPTILGKKIGISAVNFNKALENNGMQICLRDHKNRVVWQVTPKGLPFCMIIDTGKKHKESGSPVEQLKWSGSVIELFDRMIAA